MTRTHLIASVLAAVLAFLMVSIAPAAVIVDSLVESSNGWTSTDGFANWTGYITPTRQEGTHAAFFTSPAPTVKTVSSPALGGVLEWGTYTISFAMGNLNNAGFPSVNVNFAGLTLADASSATVPVPPLGGWSLYSITWDVQPGNVNTGNPLAFTMIASTPPSSWNGVLDGVGDLSDKGNGFLVDFTPIPEPSIVAMLLGLGGIGLLRCAWRRCRS